MRVVDWKTLLQVKKISFNSLGGSFMQLTVKCITFTIKELIDMKSAHWTQEVCNCFLSSQRAFESLKNLSCDFMTQNWLTKLHKNFNAIFLLLIILFSHIAIWFDLILYAWNLLSFLFYETIGRHNEDNFLREYFLNSICYHQSSTF